MTITITAFERSPDGGKGLARDTRVRWALEEVGQPYEVRLVSFRAMKEPAHLALHPFGQIPTYDMSKAISPCSRQGRSSCISPAPCGPVANGCRCAGARNHMDVDAIRAHFDAFDEQLDDVRLFGREEFVPERVETL